MAAGMITANGSDHRTLIALYMGALSLPVHERRRTLAPVQRVRRALSPIDSALSDHFATIFGSSMFQDKAS
jgi:hypothetical protein